LAFSPPTIRANETINQAQARTEKSRNEGDCRVTTENQPNSAVNAKQVASKFTLKGGSEKKSYPRETKRDWRGKERKGNYSDGHRDERVR